jgi:hypothetical protein
LTSERAVRLVAGVEDGDAQQVAVIVEIPGEEHIASFDRPRQQRPREPRPVRRRPRARRFDDYVGLVWFTIAILGAEGREGAHKR